MREERREGGREGGKNNKRTRALQVTSHTKSLPRKTIRQAVLSLARRMKMGRRARSHLPSPPVEEDEEEEEGGREGGEGLLLTVRSVAVGGPWGIRTLVANR
jgi:hypothetical protein